MFKKFGEIVDAGKLPKPSETGDSCYFVKFASEDDARGALVLDGTAVDFGRRIKVQLFQ